MFLLEFEFGFIGTFGCTFLSVATERCPKNATKGLSALWTPVSSVWVCLTVEIHGGDSKSVPHKMAETLFSRPAKLNPKQMRGHSGLLHFLTAAPQGKQQVTRWAATSKFLLPNRENSDFGQKQSGEFRAVGAPPSVRVFGSWRPYAQSDSFAPLWAKVSRGSGGGFLKGGTVGDSLEWRSFVKCEALRLSSRQGEKGTKENGYKSTARQTAICCQINSSRK